MTSAIPQPRTSEGADRSTQELRAYLSTYYGRVLERTEDLEQKACCADDTKRRYADVIDLIPTEVKARNYGCGCAIPPDDLTGLRILDLGSGAGLDAFIAARLVGPTGRVIGVDMTAEQLAIARRNIGPVMKAYAYVEPNVEFHEGYIETAESIPDGSVDLVVSDCVINLSPRKDLVLGAAYRVLAAGGELYVSDIVADRHVPEEIRSDRKLVAECLGGALYEHEFLDTVRDAGFGDPRIVTRSLVEEDVAGVPIRFYSVTVRAFKLEGEWDRRCEDYGQIARYLGNCEAASARFTLDDHHVFEAGRPTAVCRNTARMLSETRLQRYFEVTAPGRHLGLFDCGGGEDGASGAPCC